MNLNDIIQAAQGGQGVNNLATQFGLRRSRRKPRSRR